jgi:hypothetical protein
MGAVVLDRLAGVGTLLHSLNPTVVTSLEDITRVLRWKIVTLKRKRSSAGTC